MIKNKLFNKSSENMSEIPDSSVDLIVTSPPYNIDINYGNKWVDRKIIESKSIKYNDNLAEDEYRKFLQNVANECVRVLKDEGTVFFNLKNRLKDDRMEPPFWIVDIFKDLYLKNIIIWNFDWGGATSRRFSSRYEYVFFFSKNKKQWKFNLDDISIPSVNYRPDRYKTQYKNPSDVWKIPLVSGNAIERTEHPAQYPEKLIERIIKAVTDEGDLVLDPFMGSGTSAVVAKKLKRLYVGYEINAEYIEIAKKRLKKNED
jgi:DNA modification methylase